MARRHVLLSVLLGASLQCLAVGRAAAHSSPPRITQIILPSAREAMVATTRGLIFGDPTTGSWSLLCAESFGVANGTPYRVARLPTGRLLLANLRGLLVSDDRGCTFRPHATLGTRDVTYLAQHPADPRRLFVTVFGKGQGGVLESTDGGETFTARYRASDEEFVNSVLASSVDPQQLYATLSTTDEASRMFVLASADGGTTWSRSELDVGANVLDVSLLAVHSRSVRELLVRVRHFGDEGDDLLRSVDGGRTFTSIGHFPAISSAAYADDGATVFVVSGEGLVRASTSSYVFEPVGPRDRMTYAAVLDHALFLGAFYVEGDTLKVTVRTTEVSDPQLTLAPWMSFDEVRSRVTCPAPSTVGRDCTLDWIDWSREFLSAPPTTPVATPR